MNTASDRRVPSARWERAACYLFNLYTCPAGLFSALAIPRIMASYGLDYATLGTVRAAGSILNGVITLAGGVIVTRIGSRSLLLVSGLLGLVGGFILAMGSHTAIYIAITLLGGLIASLSSLISLLLAAGADPARRTTRIVRVSLFLNIAVMVLPFIMGYFLGWCERVISTSNGWRLGSILLFALQGVMLLVLSKLPLPASAPKKPDPLLSSVFRSFRAWLLVMLVCLHSGADNAAYNWIILLTQARFPELPSTHWGYILTAISGSYVLGRTVLALVRLPPWELPMVGVLATLGALLAGLAVFWAPDYVWFVGLLTGAWLFFSANWPLLLGCAGRWFPDRHEQMISVLTAASLVVAAFADAGVGWVGQRFGLDIGFSICIVMFAVLGILAGGAAIKMALNRPATSHAAANPHFS